MTVGRDCKREGWHAIVAEESQQRSEVVLQKALEALRAKWRLMQASNNWSENREVQAKGQGQEKNWEPAKQARFRAQKQPRVPNIYIVRNVASRLVWKFKQLSKSQEESWKRKGSEEEWQQKKDLDHTAASTCPGQRVCGILPKTKANLSWAHNWMCLKQILPCPRNILIMNRFPQGRSKHTPACVKSTRHGPIIFKVAEQEHWINFYLDKFSLFYTLLKYLLIGK